MMAVGHRNMWQWINDMYVYLYVQIVGFIKWIIYIILDCTVWTKYAVAQLAEELRYKRECRGFYSRWGSF